MAQTNKPPAQGQKLGDPAAKLKAANYGNDANMPMGKPQVGSLLYNYQMSQGGAGATNQAQNGYGAKPIGGSGATNGVSQIGGSASSPLSQMQSFMPATNALAQPTGNPAASPLIHPMTPAFPPAGVPTNGYSGQTNQPSYGGQTNQAYAPQGHLTPPSAALATPPPIDIAALLQRFLASKMQQQQAQSPYTQFLAGLPMLR